MGSYPKASVLAKPLIGHLIILAQLNPGDELHGKTRAFCDHVPITMPSLLKIWSLDLK